MSVNWVVLAKCRSALHVSPLQKTRPLCTSRADVITRAWGYELFRNRNHPEDPELVEADLDFLQETIYYLNVASRYHSSDSGSTNKHIKWSTRHVSKSIYHCWRVPRKRFMLRRDKRRLLKLPIHHYPRKRLVKFHHTAQLTVPIKILVTLKMLVVVIFNKLYLYFNILRLIFNYIK